MPHIILQTKKKLFSISYLHCKKTKAKTTLKTSGKEKKFLEPEKTF